MFSRFLFSALAITLIMTGCQSKSAYEYNQKLVKIENSLLPDIGRTEDLVAKYAETGQFDSVASVSNAMAEKVNARLEEVKSIPAPKVKDGETFKKAYIRYFEFLKSVYLSYRDVGLEETVEGREEKSEVMLQLVSKKDNVIAELQGIQKQYAKANGFKMEE